MPVLVDSSLRVYQLRKSGDTAKRARVNTLYFWDSAEARIRFIYWNSAGDVSEGTVFREGDRLTFAERHTDAGRAQQMRNFWTQEGPEQYSVTTQRLKDGVWETSLTMTLRKVRQSRKLP